MTSSEQPAEEPRVDDHPDRGQEEFQRSGREEDELTRVGEGESSADDTTEPSSDDSRTAGVQDPGPDVAATPLTHPKGKDA